jgi:hypothetical protein
MNKRIESELVLLISKFSNISFHKNNYDLTLNIKIININMKLLLINYPTKAPFATINNIEYFNIINTLFFKKYLSEILSKNFICMRVISKLSYGKWTPFLKLTDIINEILDMINIKKRIVKRFLADKICDKYINNDLNFQIKKYI